MAGMQGKLIICTHRRFGPQRPSCAARGSETLAEQLEQALAERGIELELERVECLGECESGPNMRLAPGGTFFRGVDETRLNEVLEAAAAFAAAGRD